MALSLQVIDTDFAVSMNEGPKPEALANGVALRRGECAVLFRGTFIGICDGQCTPRVFDGALFPRFVAAVKARSAELKRMKGAAG